MKKCCSTEQSSPCCKKKKCCMTIVALILLVVAGAAGFYYWVGQADAQNSAASAAEGDAAKAAEAAKKSPPLNKAVKDSTVYATVNGEKLTGKDVNAMIKTLPPQIQGAPSAQILPMLVNQMVNDRLVDAAAVKEGLANDAKVKERVALAEKQIARERYVEKNLEGKTTEEALRKKYEEILFSNPRQEEVHARHILVKDEALAKELIEKLNKGADFAKLAKENSIDPSKDNGGDLGYFVKGMMVKEFGEAAFALKKGEYTKTPVKTQFGYHIIEVEDKRMQPKPEYAQVKDQVRGQLNEDLIRQMIDGLRKDAKVEINLPK
ncbi:MAG TPA: peptidylprolyl isomerase [Alphaproteobacteria bacterium]